MIETIKEMVETINGKKVKKSLCRKIGDKYYLIGDITIKDSGDCYLIDEKYVRSNSGFIEYDHIKGQYIRKTQADLIYGIVEVDGTDYIMGWFSHDPTRVFNVIRNNNTVPCICDEVTKFLVYSTQYNAYVDPREMRVDRNIANQPKGVYSSFGANIYSVDEESINLARKHYIDCKEAEISPFILYTVGLEYETSSGQLPEHLCYRYGLIPLKDGSIQGYEYVTTPLSPGELDIINKQCEVLSQYCNTNMYCSLHNHMGGYPIDKMKVLALYELCRRVQDEIFAILPPFKRDVRFIANKKETKDHCQLLPRLDIRIYNEEGKLDNKMLNQSFAYLATFFNDGVPPKVNNGVLVHTREGANKWDYKRRYYWVNFIPLLFKKQRTVEFRAHHGTLNKYKVMNWLWITNAIMRYADMNTELILKSEAKIRLEDVLKGYIKDFGTDGSEYAESIIKYARQRYKYFSKHLLEDDIYCEREFNYDSSYTWPEGQEKKVTVLKEKSPTTGVNWALEEALLPDLGTDS